MTLALCSSLRSRNNTFEDFLESIICNFILQYFSETFNQIESKKARNNLLKGTNSDCTEEQSVQHSCVEYQSALL